MTTSSLGSSQTPAFLKNKRLVLFCFSRISSFLAFQMLSVAVAWQIYALTNKPIFLGLVGLAQFLPMFFLTLAVGHVADQYDRRMVVRICQFVEGTGAILLAMGSYSGWLNKESILVIVAVIGAARAFEGPTMQSLLPALVTVEDFPRAIAWVASATQTASIIGPALGGLLYAVSPMVVYLTAGILLLGACFLVTLIRIEQVLPKREPVSLQSIFAGMSFIFNKQVILGAISLDLFAVLLGGATALLPIYAREILKVGSLGLGILRSAPAIGAVITSLYLAHKPLRHRVGRIMFTAVIIFGLVTIIFAISRSFWLSLGSLIILGAADVFSVVIRQSLVQIETPDEMRGRVNAVNSMFIGTSNQLGEFESGITAAWFGAVPAALLGGIGTIAVVLLWMRMFPALTHADTLEPSTVKS